MVRRRPYTAISKRALAKLVPDIAAGLPLGEHADVSGAMPLEPPRLIYGQEPAIALAEALQRVEGAMTPVKGGKTKKLDPGHHVVIVLEDDLDQVRVVAGCAPIWLEMETAAIVAGYGAAAASIYTFPRADGGIALRTMLVPMDEAMRASVLVGTYRPRPNRPPPLLRALSANDGVARARNDGIAHGMTRAYDPEASIEPAVLEPLGCEPDSCKFIRSPLPAKLLSSPSVTDGEPCSTDRQARNLDQALSKEALRPPAYLRIDASFAPSGLEIPIDSHAVEIGIVTVSADLLREAPGDGGIGSLRSSVVPEFPSADQCPIRTMTSDPRLREKKVSTQQLFVLHADIPAQPICNIKYVFSVPNLAMDLMTSAARPDIFPASFPVEFARQAIEAPATSALSCLSDDKVLHQFSATPVSRMDICLDISAFARGKETREFGGQVNDRRGYMEAVHEAQPAASVGHEFTLGFALPVSWPKQATTVAEVVKHVACFQPRYGVLVWPGSRGGWDDHAVQFVGAGINGTVAKAAPAIEASTYALGLPLVQSGCAIAWPAGEISMRAEQTSRDAGINPPQLSAKLVVELQQVFAAKDASLAVAREAQVPGVGITFPCGQAAREARTLMRERSYLFGSRSASMAGPDFAKRHDEAITSACVGVVRTIVGYNAANFTAVRRPADNALMGIRTSAQLDVTDVATAATDCSTARRNDACRGTYAGVPAVPGPLNRTDSKITIGNEAGGAANLENRCMPDEGPLAALARAALPATMPQDVLRMRIVNLRPCAPWRIGDVSRLAANCERFEAATDYGRAVFHADGNQVLRHGIDYRDARGVVADLRSIATVMVDIAGCANRQVRAITAEARAVAVWMEARRGRARLVEPYRWPPPDQIMRGELHAATRSLFDEAAPGLTQKCVAKQGAEDVVRSDRIGCSCRLPGSNQLSQFVRNSDIPRSAYSNNRRRRFRIGDVARAPIDRHKPIPGRSPLCRGGKESGMSAGGGSPRERQQARPGSSCRTPVRPNLRECRVLRRARQGDHPHSWSDRVEHDHHQASSILAALGAGDLR